MKDDDALFQVGDDVVSCWDDDDDDDVPSQRGVVVARSLLTAPGNERQDTWAYLADMKLPGWPAPLRAWWLQDWLEAP